ncbi:HmuY family protein [Marinomonas sp. 2405UD68-3]|uniref:HmuY family protein n=1 Tax=Marinomonas sp. 2405UD68-3 TaxID=3391835 RepID=UPI0039C9D39F
MSALSKCILYPCSLTAGAILLVACGGGGSADGGESSSNNEGDPSTVLSESDQSLSSNIIDASDYVNYAYFNLDTNQVVELTEEEAKTDTNWHVGFRRSSIILNGGTSGAGQVSAALVTPQDDFYIEGDANNSVFLNATPEAELNHLTSDVDVSALTYQADTFSYAVVGTGTTTGTLMDLGWYNYDVATHSISANTDNMWLLKSASGDSYARFSTQTLNYTETLDVTFRFDVQAQGSNQFVDNNASFSASIPKTGGQACFDFDTNTNVDCRVNEDWDLQLQLEGRDFLLKTNSGPSGGGSGGAFGPFLISEKDTYVSGAMTSTGADISRHYESDSNAGIFLDQSWYAYNLEGNHKLWPNYRTYVINTNDADTESTQYKLQITNYYSDTGESGHPNIRFQEAN